MPHEVVMLVNHGIIASDGLGIKPGLHGMYVCNQQAIRLITAIDQR